MDLRFDQLDVLNASAVVLTAAHVNLTRVSVLNTSINSTTVVDFSGNQTTVTSALFVTSSDSVTVDSCHFENNSLHIDVDGRSGHVVLGPSLTLPNPGGADGNACET
jgi:hypothetical protein